MTSELTVKAIRESISFCGLVCALCSEGRRGCQGCRPLAGGCDAKADCRTKQCCEAKGVQGCWECEAFPCGGEMQKSHRTRAFLRCAQEDGIEQLAMYLHRNALSGVTYHPEGGGKGDYDRTEDEEQVLLLLRQGRN